MWKDIEGYEGLYQVSNTGEVRSLDRKVQRDNTNDYIRKGKLLKKSLGKYGYLTVGLTIESKTITKYVHRLVAIAFIDNPENKSQVNHIDGDKTNNNDWNLEWNTPKENMKHAYDNGLLSFDKHIVHYSKEENGNSLLTEEQVKEIRLKYKPYKYSAKKLSREYSVSSSCIEHIIGNRSWKI